VLESGLGDSCRWILKLTGKTIFKMEPDHHHFEQLGWTEPQIVIRVMDHRGDAGPGPAYPAEAAV